MLLTFDRIVQFKFLHRKKGFVALTNFNEFSLMQQNLVPSVISLKWMKRSITRRIYISDTYLRRDESENYSLKIVLGTANDGTIAGDLHIHGGNDAFLDPSNGVGTQHVPNYFLAAYRARFPAFLCIVHYKERDVTIHGGNLLSFFTRANIHTGLYHTILTNRSP